jgi:hypothetical protein
MQPQQSSAETGVKSLIRILPVRLAKRDVAITL